MEKLQTVLIAITPLLLAALAALGLWALRKWEQARELDEHAKDSAAQDVLAAVTDWLQPVLFNLITQAEREYGTDTGRLKLVQVITQAAALLPDNVKGLVDADWLAAQVEAVLAKAKLAWAENPGLIDAGGVAIAELVKTDIGEIARQIRRIDINLSDTLDCVGKIAGVNFVPPREDFGKNDNTNDAAAQPEPEPAQPAGDDPGAASETAAVD